MSSAMAAGLTQSAANTSANSRVPVRDPGILTRPFMIASFDSEPLTWRYPLDQRSKFSHSSFKHEVEDDPSSEKISHGLRTE